MPELVEECAKHIATQLWSFSTVLLKILVDKNGNPKSQQIGSGTYVTLGQIHGILTASHCTDELKGDYRLGLIAGPEGVEHNLFIERNTIEIINISSRVTDEYGPDLAFIILTDSDKIGTIKASKSFYNLLRVRDRMLNNPPSNRDSIWYLCGIPHERMKNGASEVGFDNLLEFEVFCGSAGVNRQYEKDGYDYYEIDIDANCNVPLHFGGMSGGALWQVPIAPSKTGSFTAIDHFLSGVIFYQGVSENGKRFLRCHGRHSIYKHVIEKLR